MLKGRIYRLLFISWMVLITVLSFLSFEDLDDSVSDINYIDKAVHFMFHFVAAILGSLFLREWYKEKIPFGFVTLRIFIALVIYGIIIEVLQGELTPWRGAEVADGVADTLGALAGIALLKVVFSRNRRLKWKN